MTNVRNFQQISEMVSDKNLMEREEYLGQFLNAKRKFFLLAHLLDYTLV